MANNITVKDASGSNVVIRTTDVGAGVEANMSIPTNTAGVAADFGAGTGGTTTTPRVIIDSSQLAALSTTAQTMSAGFQLVDLPTNGTLSTATLKVGGVAASGASASGNPVPAAGLAVSSETVVTAGQAAALITDLARKLIVLPYANPENFVSGAITSAMTGTTSTSLLAAPASGLRNYITQITISNAHATQGTDLVIQDGSGGTTLYTIPAAANYGGSVITFPVPLRQPTTATAIFCANVTSGASTKVSASGYKGA